MVAGRARFQLCGPGPGEAGLSMARVCTPELTGGSTMLSSLLLLNSLQNNATRSQRVDTSDLAGLLLLAQMLSQGRPSRPSGPRTPERSQLRRMTLRAFVRDCYLPERNHRPTGPTAELAGGTLDRLHDAMRREILVGELSVTSLRQFRNWLTMRIANGLSPATANIHLRQLRAIWNHAARCQWTAKGTKWRAIKRPPKIDFFQEAPIRIGTPGHRRRTERSRHRPVSKQARSVEFRRICFGRPGRWFYRLWAAGSRP